MNIFDAEETGRRIKYWIEVRKVKQKDLAKLIGVTNTTMSKKLKGKVTLSLCEAVQITNFLNIPVDEIVGYSNTSNRTYQSPFQSMPVPVAF